MTLSWGEFGPDLTGVELVVLPMAAHAPQRLVAERISELGRGGPEHTINHKYTGTPRHAHAQKFNL